jgi:DNA polymerase III delta prime subunit
MYYKLKSCLNFEDLKKERTETFNKLIKNPKLLLNLRLRSYLNNNELEALRNILAFFKYYKNIKVPIEFIKQYNLEKYIKRSFSEPASNSDICEYFKVYKLDNIQEYEYKLLKILEMICMDYINFIKLLE